MIAIILWVIAILIIAFTSCPGFATMMATIFVISFPVLLLYMFVANLINREPKHQERRPRIRGQDIEEWERKWKRPHPSRTINPNR